MNRKSTGLIPTSRPERAGNRLRPNMTYSPPKKRAQLFFTMRARLFALFLLITLLPMALLSFFNHLSTQRGLENAANQLLLMAASQTANDIDTFLSDNAYTISDESKLEELNIFLSLPKELRQNSPEEKSARATLETLYSKQYVLNPNIQSYLLLGVDGEVVLSTDEWNYANYLTHLGLMDVDPYAYNLMIKTGYTYISPVLVSPDGKMGNFIFASRITDANRETIGIIAAQYNAKALQALVEKYNDNAGPGSYASLYDEKQIRLGHGIRPDFLFKSVVPLDNSEIVMLRSVRRLPSLPLQDLSTDNPSLAQGLANIYKEEPFFKANSEDEDREELYSGAVAQLKNRSWLVSFVQPQSAFMAPVREQTTNTIYLSAVFLALSMVAAGFTTQRLTNPITRLTRAAERVSAGDLWIQAPEGKDEIGKLGSTFNIMTVELRRTLEGLEQRVAERTIELAKASSEAQHRAKQLETISEVIRAIASIQDPDQLLSQVTHLISERFGYYHTGIFLIDKATNYAVLRATNSEGGQRMLARNHRLKIGQEGIVGYVTSHGEPRIAHDVGKDAVYFDNPDLPYTRSEMALPLKIGQEVLGALDVQTMEQAAFTEEDIKLLSTLADQVSLAIENVRLYSETKQALAEMHTLHRQYLREAWNEVVAERGKSGYQYNFGKISPLPSDISMEVWERLEAEELSVIVTDEAENSTGKDLIAPIKVRGEVVGMLNLEEGELHREWTVDDLNLIGIVADQVGLAIENARLIEQTRRRAEREHLVSEITNKLRASNDPKQILETAARELRQALRANQARVVILPAGQKKPISPVESENQQLTGSTQSESNNNGRNTIQENEPEDKGEA